jgi:signal transduction histidine kinase
LIAEIKKALYKNGYLLIAAAWLYTLSFIFVNYWSYSSSPSKVKQSLEAFMTSSEQSVNDIIADTPLIVQLMKEKMSDTAFKHAVKTDFGIFIYQLNDIGNPILTFWNTNVVLPLVDEVNKQDGTYFVDYQNGQFQLIKRTVTLQNKTILLLALVPVRWDYFIENKYLHKQFAAFPGLENRYTIVDDPTAIAINSTDGKVLFYIQELEVQTGSKLGYISIFFRVLAIIAFLVVINAVAVELNQRTNFKTALSFLVITLAIIRLITYFLPFPFDFRKLELFDPSVYASSSIHPSLGDLLINVVLIFWISSFIKSFYRSVDFSLYTVSKKWNYAFAALLCFLLVGLSIGFESIIRSLISDSKISFDATNFFSLNSYTVISFAILCLLVFSFIYLSHLLLRFLDVVLPFSLPIKLLAVVLAGLTILSISIGDSNTYVRIFVLVWLLMYVAIVHWRKKDITLPLQASGMLLWWLMFFSLSVAGLITYQNRMVEIEQRKKIAEKLSLQTDPSGENLISIAITNFNNQFLSTNFDRLSYEFSNKFIKDSLINENFSGYLNKYDTRIYTFDSLQQALYNEDSTTYDVINSIIQNQSKPTAIPDLFYYENSFDKFSYLYQKEIKDTTNRLLGHLIVIAKPKRYKSEALYPELFKQVKDVASDLNTNYAYAVYSNQKLINSYSDYSFATTLQDHQLQLDEFEIRNSDNFSELWYNAGNNKIVVVARQNQLPVELITLFAYLFCAFLVVFLSFRFFNLLLQLRFNIVKLRRLMRLSIRNQIQTTIIAVSVFSFVVIGIATISFFIARFERSNRERLVKAIQVMSTEIENKVRSQLVFDDVLSISDIGLTGDLEKKIIEVSEIHNVDVNFYDLGGNLKVSTQPYIYNKHVLSDKMEPTAFYELHVNNKSQFIQDEQVGKFSFLSIYVPIRDESGSPNAYLNIPYLNSQNELNLEISNFLITIINLNAFIFLLAGAIALSVTNRITSSFSLIGNKMKEVNLGKHIETIEWVGNDEIGILIMEYNKMVRKLEESAIALAKSEREGAWREMARQVAHEIKNPLTPMKLSIQYLQKAIEADLPTVKALSHRVATTLVEQIDQLSKIASDFSQFANIGQANKETFLIQEIVQAVIDLHNLEDRVTINWTKAPTNNILIFADKIQTNRLLTNLIQNAIQAVDESKQVLIEITDSVQDNWYTLVIKDNGTGIPTDVQQKIFTPNFTTKTAGTGLGLAICKGIVENAGGKIWFESASTGTSFYVQLPLVNNAIDV